MSTIKEYMVLKTQEETKCKNILKKITKSIISDPNDKGLNFEAGYLACYKLTLYNKKNDEVYSILSECLKSYIKTTQTEHKIILCKLRDIYMYYIRIKNVDIFELYNGLV